MIDILVGLLLIGISLIVLTVFARVIQFDKMAYDKVRRRSGGIFGVFFGSAKPSENGSPDPLIREGGGFILVDGQEKWEPQARISNGAINNLLGR